MGVPLVSTCIRKVSGLSEGAPAPMSSDLDICRVPFTGLFVVLVTFTTRGLILTIWSWLSSYGEVPMLSGGTSSKNGINVRVSGLLGAKSIS